MGFLKYKSTKNGSETYYDLSKVVYIRIYDHGNGACIVFGYGEDDFIKVTEDNVDMEALRKYVRASVLI